MFLKDRQSIIENHNLRKGEIGRDIERETKRKSARERLKIRDFVCVCVRERERAREIKRERESWREEEGARMTKT
jgi:hypothetical protein